MEKKPPSDLGIGVDSMGLLIDATFIDKAFTRGNHIVEGLSKVRRHRRTSVIVPGEGNRLRISLRSFDRFQSQSTICWGP